MSSVSEILVNLVAMHGKDIANEPRRVKSFLLDMCPTSKREVRALLMVLDEGYVQKILQDNASTSSGVLLHRFCNLLHNEIGLDMVLAKWAVQAWIDALFPQVVVTKVAQIETEQPTNMASLKHNRKSNIKSKLTLTQSPTIDFDAAVPHWMERLWSWAYTYNVSSSKLPRNKHELIDLTSLDLVNNYLTILPAELGHLTNLTSIDLSRNYLRSIPAELGRLSNLTTLNLSNNQLVSLPPELGSLINLSLLNLANNDLKDLPPEIGRLSNLKMLDISNNNLRHLPTEIDGLTNLTLFYLANNHLKSLPIEIGNLRSLNKLYLAYNNLVSLPPEIGQLTNLTVLNLANNELMTVPCEISGLTNLSSLYLQNNQLIAQVSKNITSWLPNLRQLKLSDLGYAQISVSLPKTPWYKKLL
jgi:Leucine-rich repeat (LRR) protein